MNNKYILRAGLLLSCISLFFASCKKDQNTSPGGGTTTDSGRFSGNISCGIIAPPASVKLDAYYKKYVNCSGIPVVGNGDIPDAAISSAEDIIAFMLKDKDDLRKKMAEKGVYFALAMHSGTGLNELPEFDGLGPQIAGLTDPDKAVSCTSADNVLCNADDKSVGTSNVVHEFAHMMHLVGYNNMNIDFDASLKAVYENAKAKGLWANTYAITNYMEYFAQGVVVWYGLIAQVEPGAANGFANEIYTRGLMKDYDPELYNFLAKYLNSYQDVPGYLKASVLPDGSCDATVTDIDGNVYNVVSIGAQCWMKENLRTTRLNDGTTIFKMTSYPNWDLAWSALTTPGWLYYNHNAANNDKYGKLYNWYAASNTKLCPAGWHTATQEEWNQLLKQTNSKYYPKSLRSVTGWNDNTGSTNSTGFSALPGGGRPYDFSDSGTVASYWSSSFDSAHGNAVAIQIPAGTQYTVFNGYPKTSGIACRCVKD